MKKSLQVFVICLALCTGYALAQEGGTNSPASGQPENNGAQTSTMGTAGQTPTQDQMGSPTSANTQSATVDDQTLQRQIHDQLASNPNLQNVQVSVNNGKATLSGTVASKSDRKEARKLAKSIQGVKKVKDELTVSSESAATKANPGGSGSMSENAGAASSSTATTPEASGSAAQEQNEQTGSTSATTPNSTSSNPMNEQPPQSSSSSMSSSSSTSSTTPEESNSNSQWGSQSSQAQTENPNAASGTNPQSTAEQSGSSNAVGAPSGMGSSQSSASSDQVRNDIQTAFRNEPTLTSSNIAVNVTDDSVELSGTVPSSADRDEAKRIAESYAGSRRVVDNIRVASGTGTPDGSSGNIGAQTGPTAPSNPNPSASPTSPNPTTPPPNPEQSWVPQKQ